MKILYMSITFSCNKDGLYNNLVDTILDRGHEICIVRSKAGIDHSTYEEITLGFNLLTVKTADPFNSNLIKKGLNQIMLASSFMNAIKKFLGNEKFDLILYTTPPVTLASVVKYCKSKYKAKTFLMLKDIFPQNAVDLGMMRKGGPIYNFFRLQEKRYYRYSDYIGCMSQGNKDYVLKHNSEIDKKKVHIFPNSITIDEVEGLSFNDDKTVFMFGGNLGKPQNISGLLEIIEKLKDYDKAQFVIVGEGTEAKNIQQFLSDHKEVKNLVYKKQLPQQEYEQLLKSADVGLISLDPRFTIPNIPSRFQSYLKLKKPVLAITDVHTDLRDMIEENDCGWWCDSTDKQNVIRVIKNICEAKEKQREKGLNGREYLNAAFDVKNTVKKIERFVQEG